MKIQLRIGAPDAITMAYATALQIVRAIIVAGHLVSGVEGSLHSVTIHGIISLLTGTSLLFGKFKIREGIEIKIKSHF
jgi:hypothetical protein